MEVQLTCGKCGQAKPDVKLVSVPLAEQGSYSLHLCRKCSATYPKTLAPSEK